MVEKVSFSTIFWSPKFENLTILQEKSLYITNLYFQSLFIFPIGSWFSHMVNTKYKEIKRIKANVPTIYKPVICNANQLTEM